MDCCFLVPRLNGNKLGDNVGSDLEMIGEGGEIDGEAPVDDNTEVLNHIPLG